jgi:hypothetical protein
LGTCRTTDCFVTDRKGNPVDFDNVKIQVKQANKKGGFVVKPKEEPQVTDYADFGTEVRIEEYNGIGK